MTAFEFKCMRGRGTETENSSSKTLFNKDFSVGPFRQNNYSLLVYGGGRGGTEWKVVLEGEGGGRGREREGG